MLIFCEVVRCYSVHTIRHCFYMLETMPLFNVDNILRNIAFNSSHRWNDHVIWDNDHFMLTESILSSQSCWSMILGFSSWNCQPHQKSKMHWRVKLVSYPLQTAIGVHMLPPHNVIYWYKFRPIIVVSPVQDFATSRNDTRRIHRILG